MPANVVVVDGVPDFATLDRKRAAALLKLRRCAMCGQNMSAPFAFVGGPAAIEAKHFVDGPMHPECARYSFAVCPFVSGGKRRYRETSKQHPNYHVETLDVVSERPSSRMGMLLASSWDVSPTGVLIARGVTKIQWEDEICGSLVASARCPETAQEGG